MQYKQTYKTKNKTAWINTCQFIILHHTATGEGTLKGLINAFTGSRQVSAHYLVDTNGDVYKFGEDKDILWHAWTSNWGKIQDLNKFSIWIEIIGPLADGGFTQKQKEAVAILVKELAAKYSIWKENVLRHKDIAPGRKWDVADSFWSWNFKSFEEYKNSLFFKEPEKVKTKYTDIMERTLKETWFEAIFDKHEGDKPLTEQETKELFEIFGARLWEKIMKSK